MTNLNNIVEILAKQALGGNQSTSSQSGLGGVLGAVLGQLGNQSKAQPQQSGLGGVLGSVLGQLGNAQAAPKTSQSTAQTLLIAVLPLVLAWIQKNGGLQGSLDKLRGQGLSSQVDDWVSTGAGANAAVNQQHVQSLFDDQEIEKVAAETHTNKQDIYAAISQVLPDIIDSLTPQGTQTNKQEANDDIQNVLNTVAGLLKR